MTSDKVAEGPITNRYSLANKGITKNLMFLYLVFNDSQYLAVNADLQNL